MGSDHLILCASLVLRNGTDDEVKKKFYAAIESMALKVTEKK
jgi:hypothetical protein